METEVPKDAHNELALHLHKELAEEQFKHLKNLFRDAPLSTRDIESTTDVMQLIQKLMDYTEISVGDYDNFTTRLNKVNKKLGSYVVATQQKIKRMLSGERPEEGIPSGQRRLEVEQELKSTKRSRMQLKQEKGHTQPPQEVVPEQETGTAGNFHKREDGVLPFATLKAIGISDMDKSIGLIKIKHDGSLLKSGTGFCFGRNYLMTAYHVFKEKIQIVWERTLKKAEQSDKKEYINQKLQDLFGFKSGNINPTKQRLPFGQLFEFLKGHEVQIEVSDTLFKQEVTVQFGVRDGKTTAGEFHLEYDIPFADADHDVIVLKIIETTPLPPPLKLENYSVRDTVHVIGYPEGPTEVDLLSDIQCKVYVNDEELQEEVAKAIKWWADERQYAVADEYAECRYTNGINHTVTGKMFLHTSKKFEYRSSGSPAVAMIHNEPFVQMMYLQGYPNFCYASRKFPPPEYLFEAGIAMPVVTQLLRECCPEVIDE